MIRKASAVWEGGFKDGGGRVSSETGVLKEAPYGFKSRFESGPGTNPEELIAAAHAACFSITASHLDVAARIPGIEQGKFDEIAAKAKAGCPVSKLLKARITMDARLEKP